MKASISSCYQGVETVELHIPISTRKYWHWEAGKLLPIALKMKVIPAGKQCLANISYVQVP